MSDFTVICDKVGDFNYLFGVLKTPYDNTDTKIKLEYFDNLTEEFNKTQYDLRYSLINEEILETVEAYENDDIIEIIDGICDILYVVAGAKVYFNLPNSNINFKINNTAKSINLEFNKEVLTNNLLDKKFLLNNLIEELNTSNLKLKLISDRIIKEYSISDVNRYNSLLDSIVYSLFQISYILDINVMKYFDIVHDSNMTKVCSTEEEAIRSVEFYKNDKTCRYKTPTYRMINYKDTNYFVVYDEETKKILKSINYMKVKFD